MVNFEKRLNNNVCIFTFSEQMLAVLFLRRQIDGQCVYSFW